MYQVTGKVYNVKADMDSRGIPNDFSPGHYEYELQLIDANGKVVAALDSLMESKNPDSELTKEQAELAVRKIQEAIAIGVNPKAFFNIKEAQS